MSLNIRTYHELTEADRSGLVDQIGAQRRRVADRLAGVRRVVAVREYRQARWTELDEVPEQVAQSGSAGST